jgi:TIR domain
VERYDLFVCHVSEDKDAFVRPLCRALTDLKYHVWYDEFSLKIGDSLRRSIDRGLNSSRYGVVILSPHFFEKNWSNYELDALVSRENDSGDKVILPIWLGVSKKDVVQYSATLADRVAADASKGIHEVVKKIAEVMLEPTQLLTTNPHQNSNVNVLILSLYEANPGDRAKAARALGHLGPAASGAVDALKSRLRDSSGHVRDAAQWALLKISPENKPSLNELSTSEVELLSFQEEFERSTLQNYHDLLLGAEDF